jgi:hypothetical protein
VAAIRAKKGDLSANCSFTFSNGADLGIASPESSYSKAGASYAAYKERLEHEDRLRTDEATRIRETLERARLQSAEEIVKRKKRIEREAFEAAVLEEAAMRTNADHDAQMRIAQFHAKQEELARQRAEKETRRTAPLEVALLQAEVGIVVDDALTETYDFAERVTQSEIELQLLAARKIRLREESRLRIEEKARARFAAFKAYTNDTQTDNQLGVNAVSAVKDAHAPLSGATDQLTEERSEPVTPSVVVVESKQTQFNSANSSTKSASFNQSSKSSFSANGSTDSLFQGMSDEDNNNPSGRDDSLFCYSAEGSGKN